MQALTDFIERTLSLTTENSLTAVHDPEWVSPCELKQEDGETFWRPIAQSSPVSFDGLSNALEIPIHPDICHYYGSYWSGTLEANSEEGPVSLIQLWNEDDFERLISNLIGHALSKFRAKDDFTVFFATTESDSELFLSIDNETGNILLEEPGKRPLRVVDDNIHAFLNRLTPEIRASDIY